jgi:hypothetical protein
MATNITTNFVGEDLKVLLGKAVYGNKTIASDRLTVVNDVRYKLPLKKMSTSGLLAAATCDYTDAGTLSLTEKMLEPFDFQLNKTECKLTFDAYWNPLEGELSDFIANYYVKATAAELETLMWASTTAATINGLVYKATQDSDVIDVTGTTLSVSNIQAELTKVYAAIPDALKNDPDMTIFLSPSALGYWRIAQGYAAVTNNGGTMDNFNGIRLQECGISTNRMFAVHKSNFVAASKMLSGANEINIIDTAATLGDKNIRFVMNFSFGIDYIDGTEVVLYQ